MLIYTLCLGQVQTLSDSNEYICVYRNDIAACDIATLNLSFEAPWTSIPSKDVTAISFVETLILYIGESLSLYYKTLPTTSFNLLVTEGETLSLIVDSTTILEKVNYHHNILYVCEDGQVQTKVFHCTLSKLNAVKQNISILEHLEIYVSANIFETHSVYIPELMTLAESAFLTLQFDSYLVDYPIITFAENYITCGYATVNYPNTTFSIDPMKNPVSIDKYFDLDELWFSPSAGEIRFDATWNRLTSGVVHIDAGSSLTIKHLCETDVLPYLTVPSGVDIKYAPFYLTCLYETGFKKVCPTSYEYYTSDEFYLAKITNWEERAFYLSGALDINLGAIPFQDVPFQFGGSCDLTINTSFVDTVTASSSYYAYVTHVADEERYISVRDLYVSPISITSELSSNLTIKDVNPHIYITDKENEKRNTQYDLFNGDDRKIIVDPMLNALDIIVRTYEMNTTIVLEQTNITIDRVTIHFPEGVTNITLKFALKKNITIGQINMTTDHKLTLALVDGTSVYFGRSWNGIEFPMVAFDLGHEADINMTHSYNGAMPPWIDRMSVGTTEIKGLLVPVEHWPLAEAIVATLAGVIVLILIASVFICCFCTQHTAKTVDYDDERDEEIELVGSDEEDDDLNTIL